MTTEQEKIYNDFFARYGSPSKEGEVRIQSTFYNPDTIYNTDKLKLYDEWAANTLARLNKAIEQVQIYRIAICERFNELQFADIQKIVKLKREKHYYDNKIYYYLMLIDKYKDEHEEIIKSVKYSGTERKQAIADFEEFAKVNKNYTAVKDIEKSKFEK